MWRDYEKDVFCPAGLGDGVLSDRLQWGVKQTAEETEETTEERFEADSEGISEEDLLPFIALYDLYVVQRSETSADTTEETEEEPYDPLYCLSTLDIYDEDVVVSVAFDSAAVDATAPGDYELTFIVTIDRSAYNAAVSGTASTEPVIEEVIITKTVHIVTTEDYAAALADGTIIETADGTAIVVVEAEVDEEVVEEDSEESDGEDGDSEDSDSQDNDTTDSSTDKSDSDNTSTNNDSDTSNVTSPTTTTAPATSTGSGSSTSSGSTSSGSTSSGSTSSGSSSGSTSSGSSSSSSSSSGTTSTGSTSSGSTSSGSTSSGSTSSGSTSSGSTSSGSSSSGSSSSGSTSSGTSSSTATATPAPTATTHVHTWVTETVEDGYTEKVQVGTEYDYSNAEYIEGYYICNKCGYRTASGDDISEHCSTDNCGGSYSRVASHWEGLVEVPVYETVWVDTSYTITYCSECGATQ